MILTNNESRLRETAAAECVDCECAHYREAERLRRNLHDGLGPGLAGIMMRVDLLRNTLTDDRDAADELLVELRREAAEFMSEFRRVLSGRGPGELAGQDLATAVHAQAARMSRATGGALDVRTELDPAVLEADRCTQVAAFWIVTEALTNVVKHARARTCRVRVWRDGGALRLEVRDDGVGLDESAGSGVGQSSMRDRAAELGGWCAVVDGHPGLAVLAYLPDRPVIPIPRIRQATNPANQFE